MPKWNKLRSSLAIVFFLAFVFTQLRKDDFRKTGYLHANVVEKSITIKTFSKNPNPQGGPKDAKFKTTSEISSTLSNKSETEYKKNSSQKQFQPSSTSASEKVNEASETRKTSEEEDKVNNDKDASLEKRLEAEKNSTYDDTLALINLLVSSIKNGLNDTKSFSEVVSRYLFL